MKKMYRYEVPIDDQPHTLDFHGGYPVAVATVLNNVDAYMEVWAEFYPERESEPEQFQVFGTGHEIPDNAWWEGTAPRVAGLVFHLYSLEHAGEIEL